MKEFVLVSQGMEIMRTKSQEIAINYVKKENDEWFDYQQKCIDNYEHYADNYIDLEIEYPDDKKYLQLQSNWNSLRELILKSKKIYEDSNESLEESFKILKTDLPPRYHMNNGCIELVEYLLDKMNELEGDK